MSDPTERAVSGLPIPRRQLLVSVTLVISLVCLIVGNPREYEAANTFAEEPAKPAADSQETTAGDANPNRITEKQKKAFTGLAALGGIIITGVALAAFIVLWAGRLRRQIRRRLPGCDAPVRDFWFLKPPKPTVTQSSLPESRLPPHDPTPP